MQEQLVSFETAKLAKEKGFDERTILWFGKNDEIINLFGAKTFNSNIGNRSDFQCCAPTQSLLQKWLREKHSIHIVVNPTIEMYWTFGLINLGNENIKLNGPIVYNNHDYNTYEEALEIGLQEALKLIK